MAKKNYRKLAFALLVTALFLSFLIDNLILGFFSRINIPFLAGFSAFMGSTLFMAAVVIAAFIFLKKEKVTDFWAAIGLTFLAVFALKLLVARERPLGAEYLSFGLSDFSFPSAHAALSFCLLAFYCKDFSRLSYLWLGLALLVSFSRIYISAHYLSDVIAGALIGYSTGLYFAEKK